MKIAVVSVVYPGVEPYLPDFLCSLEGQTYKDFTLYLINDGLPGIDSYLDKYALNVKVLKLKGSPAFFRKRVIEWANAEDAEIIVFTDSDDYFQKNRIEVVRELLNDSDIVLNELILVGNGVPEATRMLGIRFEEGQAVSSRTLVSKNCMGLSNTAIRLGGLVSATDSIPNDIIAFDWAFFSLCLHKGARAVFTKRTCTFYRQHGNNTASPNDVSEKQIMVGVRVKREHYKLLSKLYGEYKGLSEDFDQLSRLIETDESFRQKYCRNVRAKSPVSPFWWEAIKALKELGL